MEYKIPYAKIVANRFFRAFISGFLGAIALVPAWNGNFSDIYTYLRALLLAAIVGALMALEKYVRVRISEWLKNNTVSVE